MTEPLPSLAVVIPAAGTGKRMLSEVPKQYLTLNGLTVIEQTINKFIELPFVHSIILALSADDTVFSTLSIAHHPKVKTVIGGKERADSVLSGIRFASELDLSWVMVHDAARPCVLERDIIELYHQCVAQQSAGILAVRVKDTMKRAKPDSVSVDHTVPRTDLWHALTPQCSDIKSLERALVSQLQDGLVNSAVTDEASALELNNKRVLLVASSARNIKITEPDDLELAQLFLQSEE
ncbi:2-C-methyl-D-erythritol 4-phosphate cytidylyltransferase [Psychrosphaera sp. 1_MG-2023]|uniref:2-C-methyl-D-erythritol 4-phosphate cytidylyltransferase n=1 Tax=Psychrosphaera sp. 1_MG-2023 TaxID=3062643 RepID=UPI0026E139A2|nr:2-C-methyl-D-erythritol 4-phosphate cytidylyltransferase [Psychrosphaera sp. 1_MG-2023]MDO6719121.1 2-C-methyl-D-erythritol 4-phosphate cytidylyltransferase [Psychrosphaera sp. 1_MG-2023]